jgi:hypothetical protein
MRSPGDAHARSAALQIGFQQAPNAKIKEKIACLLTVGGGLCVASWEKENKRK